jgi:osmotically inducible protein OsmC
MKINRHGSALWRGGIKDGKGAISTESGALKDYPYGFASRFEGQPGTNPEELIGAAHAGCFTMALSLILGEAKLIAETDGNLRQGHAGAG